VRVVMLGLLGGLGVMLGVLWRRDLKGKRRRGEGKRP